jgi:phosphocarrier protein
MKRTTVVVPWRHGLHLLPAGELVRMAGRFRSVIHLRRGNRIADVRRLFSVVALCATMGTALVLETSGDDEGPALESIRQLFSDAGKR